MKPKIYYWSLWFLRFFLAIAVVATVARPAFAQATVITPQTANQTIFSGQTTTAEVQIKDFGQNVHFLTYFSSTANCMMNIRFQASYDNSAFFPISEDGADARQFPQAVGGGGSFPGLVAYGWFPIIQVLLEIPSNVAGNNCHVTAYYSGTSTADSTIQQGFIQSNGFRKLIALGEPPLSVVTQAPATYGSTGGRLYVLCGTACGTAQILITPVSIPAASAANAPSDTGPVLQTINLANVNTIQTFDITAVPAESVFVSMDATPGSADWVTIYYQFLPETNIGNTVNVNCLSGCGGGGGANIVWGPDAIGVAPTEAPVQVGGLNPSGTVAELQTDAAGNTIVVGPGTVFDNPVMIGAETPGGLVQELQTDGGSTHSLNVNIQDQGLGAVLTAPAGATPTNQAITGTVCAPAVGVNYGNFVQNAEINVLGTWTGTLNFLAAAPSSAPAFVAVNAYPILTGNGFLAPVTSTTANGNWIVPVAGINQLEVCGASVATGSAQVSIVPSGENNPIIVTQPTGSNLNAQVAGVSPDGTPVGSLVNGNPVLMGALEINGTTDPLTWLTEDTTGSLRVNLTSQPILVSQSAQRNATGSLVSGSCLGLTFSTVDGASSLSFLVSGTWTGPITMLGSITGVTGTYQDISVYPVLTTAGGGFAPGLMQSTITANGNYIVYPSSMHEVEACTLGSFTGAAGFNFIASPAANATYALQPIAANLHARTEPNAAPSSACTPVVINFSSSGNNTVVAGVASEQVRIYSLNVVFGGAATVTFEDGASTPLTGPMGIFSGGSINAANEGAPQFITSSGNGFIINLSAGVQASGWGCYSQF